MRNKKCLLSALLFVSTLAFTGLSHAATSQPAMKVGDSAGGDLTGTYPNPTIRAGAVTTSKMSSGNTAAGQILTSNGAGGVILGNSLPFLDLTGHVDASGDAPTIFVNPNFCNNSFVYPQSNQVRGRVQMGGADTSCIFEWAQGTEYTEAPVFCTATISGGEPVPFTFTADQNRFIIIKREITPASIALDYICMGR